MEITLEQVGEKKLLIDTRNENEIFNATHSIVLKNGDTFSFSTRELIELSDFEKKTNNILIETILKIIPHIKRTEPIPSIYVYKNELGLPIFIKSYNNYYLIIAMGEFQYGRYILSLEGILKNNSHDIN